jgi:hypothetical protein
LLKAMVVATNAVVTHAMTIDATVTAPGGRAGVGVVEQRDGPSLHDRRGDALEDALDHLASHHRGLRVGPDSAGAPGGPGRAPRHGCASRHISTAGLRQVSTKKSSFSTASLPWCLVMTTANSACGSTNEATGAC